MENIYTSTGLKLIHHHPEILGLLKNGMARPVSLQVGPTSQCNLNCEFCSNVNRARNESLKFDDLIGVIYKLHNVGLKTVEWTGGGDPTLYSEINNAIQACSDLGLEQGFITNGIALGNIERNLHLLKWLRISMNCLDYVESIEIPQFKGVLGFSYVMNAKTTKETLMRLDGYVEKYNPTYIRIVPNCQVSDAQQIENNDKYSKMVQAWGPRYFYQAKTFSKPERCWWGYVKPFILHDGWVYPCSSVVLNSDSERQFHNKYRWVKMENLPGLYSKPILALPSNNCNHCVFHNQNAIMEDIIMNPMGLPNPLPLWAVPMIDMGNFI